MTGAYEPVGGMFMRWMWAYNGQFYDTCVGVYPARDDLIKHRSLSDKKSPSRREVAVPRQTIPWDVIIHRQVSLSKLS